MYLSSGAVMDGLVFSPWQVDGKRGGGTGEDCGEDLLSNCGWEGGGGVAAIIQHERGSFQHLLSLSHHALLSEDLLLQ